VKKSFSTNKCCGWEEWPIYTMIKERDMCLTHEYWGFEVKLCIQVYISENNRITNNRFTGVQKAFTVFSFY
jgi:hypothetical protein